MRWIRLPIIGSEREYPAVEARDWLLRRLRRLRRLRNGST
jgi:hypothetical protein